MHFVLHNSACKLQHELIFFFVHLTSVHDEKVFDPKREEETKKKKTILTGLKSEAEFGKTIFLIIICCTHKWKNYNN